MVYVRTDTARDQRQHTGVEQDVLLVLGTQHSIELDPGQYPATDVPSQLDVDLQVPDPDYSKIRMGILIVA